MIPAPRMSMVWPPIEEPNPSPQGLPNILFSNALESHLGGFPTRWKLTQGVCQGPGIGSPRPHDQPESRPNHPDPQSCALP